MKFEDNNRSLVDIDKEFSFLPQEVILTGNNLTLPQILSVARNNASVTFTTDSKVIERIKECHERMIQDVQDGVPIYGCNTGYGA